WVLRAEKLFEQLRLDDIERLIHPERFEAIMFACRILGIDRRDPEIERWLNFRYAALLEDALREMPRPVFSRFELREKLFGASAREVRAFDQRAALRRHAPDAAVRVVAARVAEIDFAMLNNRVVPISDVDRA